MDIALLLDKNGNPSSRKLTPEVCSHLEALTSWMVPGTLPAERMWCISHSHTSYPVLCKHCNKPVAWCSWAAGYNRDFCCKPCFFEWRREHPKPAAPKPDKLPMEELTRRREASNLQRYGVRYPWMLKEQKVKKAEAGYSRMAASWQDELRQHNVAPLFDTTDYTGNRRYLSVQCLKCNTKFEMQRLRWVENPRLCPTCYTPKASKGQHELADWIRSLGISVRINDRKMFAGKHEIDIFIPEKNLAIEFDGLYWHSEKGRPDSKKKSLLKMEALRDKGLKYLMMFDDEWENQQDVVKSRIRNALGISERKIFARHCSIVNLSSIDQREFFLLNHLQKSVPGAAIGLEYEGELVAAMSFGKPRFSDKYQWELLRFATKMGTSVVGGASKLFSHWKTMHPSESIVSFSDNRWGTGSFYTKLGFTDDGQTGQGYFYVNSAGMRRSRQTMQKHKLPDILKTFDITLTEQENCWNNGWYRVWDLGNTRWVMLQDHK